MRYIPLDTLHSPPHAASVPRPAPTTQAPLGGEHPSDTPGSSRELARAGSESDQSPRERSRLGGHDTLGCERQPQALSSGTKQPHGVAASMPDATSPSNQTE